MLKLSIRELFDRKSADTVRIGSGIYQCLYLSGAPAKGERRPVLVKVGTQFLELCEASVGSAQSNLEHFIARAKKTGLPQISDLMGKVVVVDHKTTQEQGIAFCKKDFRSAEQAVAAFFAGQSTGPEAVAAKTPSP